MRRGRKEKQHGTAIKARAAAIVGADVDPRSQGIIAE
jgi:hypothetical protein